MDEYGWKRCRIIYQASKLPNTILSSAQEVIYPQNIVFLSGFVATEFFSARRSPLCRMVIDILVRYYWGEKRLPPEHFSAIFCIQKNRWGYVNAECDHANAECEVNAEL